MTDNPFVVTPLTRAKISSKRAIAFLSSAEDTTIDAQRAFQMLTEVREREVRDRFDYWIDGGKPHDKYFHGWPNDPRYKNCFVFKWKDRRQHHRLYGFLCHPTPDTNPAFQVCVLVSHAIKSTFETDPGELGLAEALRINRQVQAALQRAFPETKKGRKTWVN